MNQHDGFDAQDDELSPAMRERRKVLASLIGGFAMPLLPHTPWAPNSGVTVTQPPRHLAHAASCGDFVLPITDGLTVIKAALAVGINAIPGVGGLLGALFELLWPQNAATIWDQIKDNVTKLINEAIDEERERTLLNSLEGVKRAAARHLTRIYRHEQLKSAETWLELKVSITAIDNSFIESCPHFEDDPTLSLSARCRILPMYVQLANLELLTRRDAAVNAVAYGFSQAAANNYLVEFREALERHQKRVNDALNELFDALKAQYEANRDKYREDGGNGIGSTPGWSATGAWESKKVENNTRSLLIALAQDYLKLWPSLEPGKSPPEPLTRELWFGPYGVPDLRDIGCYPRYHVDEHRAGRWIFDRKPDVVMPMSNNGGPIRHIGVPQVKVTKRDKWHFPRNFEVYREGDGKPVLPNTWGFSLAPNEGGPVVGARVDRALYISRGNIKDCATGYLVSAIHFKQSNNHMQSIGSSDFKGQEIKGHEGEDVPVPGGHVLHEIHQASTVRAMYKNIGDPSVESVGSVMFSFKLSDPGMYSANDELVRLAAIAHVRHLSPDELSDVELRLENANPSTTSPAKRAGVRSQIVREMEVEHWEQDRAAFWRYIDQVAGDD